MSNSDGRTFSLSADTASYQRNGSAYSDVVFNVPDIVNVNSNISGLYISVSNAFIPTTWYNVDETNSYMQFSLTTSMGSTSYELIIAPADYGTYDVDSFIVKLNDLFRAYPDQANPVLEFAYNPFNSRTEVIWAVGIDPTTFTLQNTTMNVLLGIDLSDVVFSSPSRKIFSKCVNFTGVTSYFFVCAELPTQNYSTEINSNFLFKVVPASGNFNSTEWNNVTMDSFLIPSRIQVSQLSIRVFDQSSRLINFHGVPWNFTLKVHYQVTDTLDYRHFESDQGLSSSMLPEEPSSSNS